MIRINLLSQKKVRRADKGQQTFMLGVLVVLIAGAGVFFLLHRPVQADIEDQEATNRRIQAQNASKQDKLKSEASIKSAVDAADKRRGAITALEEAAVTPAWMLRDLGRILTPKKRPTMTDAAAQQLRDKPQLDFDDEFDPKHLWVTSFSERDGNFKITGGAQSEGDIIEFSKRLDASVFFDAVTPDKGKADVDKATGITYYTFTITGKVVY